MTGLEREAKEEENPVRRREEGERLGEKRDIKGISISGAPSLSNPSITNLGGRQVRDSGKG